MYKNSKKMVLESPHCFFTLSQKSIIKDLTPFEKIKDSWEYDAKLGLFQAKQNQLKRIKGQKARKIKLNENKHQHPLFCCILRLLEIKKEVQFVNNSRKIYFEYSYRPDFVFIKKGEPVSTNFIYTIVELQLGTINDDHKGRVMMYNKLVLYEVPTREFIISAVSNLSEFILIKTQRENDDFTHYETTKMNFFTDGLRYLYHMINNPKDIGFVESLNQPFEINSEKYFVTKFLGNLLQ